MVDVKVTPVLEGVDVTVASTSVAVVEVATAPEVVDVKVAALLVVVREEAWCIRGGDSREQSLARHVCSVGLLVVE